MQYQGTQLVHYVEKSKAPQGFSWLGLDGRDGLPSSANGLAAVLSMQHTKGLAFHVRKASSRSICTSTTPVEDAKFSSINPVSNQSAAFEQKRRCRANRGLVHKRAHRNFIPPICTPLAFCYEAVTRTCRLSDGKNVRERASMSVLSTLSSSYCGN